MTPNPDTTESFPPVDATLVMPAEKGNPPGSGYFTGIGTGNVTWHPGEYAPGTFRGAQGVGQQAADVIYGLPLQPLPASMPAPDWRHDTAPGYWPAPSGTAAGEPIIPPCRCEQCEWALEVSGGYPGACRCDECLYGQPPGAGTVLYCRPGAADLLWALDVRDGRYEDIEGLFDAAWRESRKGFEAAARHSRQALALAWHRVEAVAAAERSAA